METRVLVVDDEESILEAVTDILEDEGFQVAAAPDGRAAILSIRDSLPSVVLLDIWMPEMDGIETLRRIKEEWPFLPVVIMSGHGTIETAVRATKLGAYDFIEKPLSYEQLIMALKNAIRFYEMQEENALLRQKVGAPKEITGKSEVITQLKRQIEVVAPTDAWVLIRGENGTGKELVAQTIHRMSKRRLRPMIDVNCAAIPEELIESELFGHEKGAFTGASTMKRGKFDLANGGTLFLDEIADMSLRTQAKILRILQEQRFERVGGSKTIKVDVRILAATNKDLEKEIEKGRFREDLYYRLNVIPIEVPPLRERKEDIPLLVDEFLEEFSIKLGMPKKTIDNDALNALMGYDWPGNVRELRNFVERLVILTPDNIIKHEALPRPFHKPDNKAVLSKEIEELFACNDFKQARTMFEKEYLIRKLKEFDGNITRTSEAIGIERRHLHRKIKSLSISVEAA